MKTPSSLPAPNLLIVDDLPANLELLIGMLQDRGFRVRPVASGERALQAARSEPPDLVLLDINMPEMDGYEVCRRLKADATLKAIPVIFISAMDGVIDKVKAFSAGGVDHIAKPFHLEEVESRVRTHLELACLRRDLEELVAHRTRELARANARLAILDQAKSDFLTLISHEIRTPLSGICGAVELLLMTHEEHPDTADWAKMYDVSRRRLITLIDDALLLTKIGVDAETGATPSCRLGDALNSARAAASPLAETRGVQVAPAPPNSGQVRGTQNYLARALQSLLETAIKFAHAGTTVRLTEATAPGEISVFIETQGGTIPPAVLPRFFDLLAVSESFIGVDALGLGPPLAERIVTLYGGTVSVENLAPSGIRLLVCLKTDDGGTATGVRDQSLNSE
ncbi:MAG: response regulator [Planctomycetota bacterium]|nr:response regulator [Planctomycetota bacterium]